MTVVKALAKRILPPGVVTHLRVVRTLPVRHWPLYWKIRSQRALGPNSPNGPRVIRSVLFVCRGNVIRSPLAAAMLRRCLSATGAAGIIIASAGLRVSPGEPADPRARRIAMEFGVSLEGHHAQPLTAELVAQADVIVAMDALVAAELLVRHTSAQAKIVLPDDIADPYDGDETEVRRCCERIHAAMQGLASKLAGLAVALAADGG